MTTNPAQIRAARAHEKRLRSNGSIRISVWLSPESAEALRRLRAVHGSNAKALRHVLGIAPPPVK